MLCQLSWKGHAGVVYCRPRTTTLNFCSIICVKKVLHYLPPHTLFSTSITETLFSHRAHGVMFKRSEKTAVDNFVKIQTALIQLSEKKNCLLPVPHFFRKKKEKKNKEKERLISWECCGLSSSALITGCTSDPKPKPCFCIWEDVWSLSWCAETCMTQLSLVFSSPFPSLSLSLMSQHLC